MIAADVDTVWRLTQDPDAHMAWDLRFSRIAPLSTDDRGRTTFAYERRVPLHTLRGTGVSLGERTRADGTRTSALAFDTGHRCSPLRRGRGYWRYEPVPGGTRFVTGFDYEPGFGRLLDLAARPAVRWLTALSFDRLRRWAETGERPPRVTPLSLVAVWRRDRPRASRCRTAPPAGGAMRAAPATLGELAGR